MLFGSSVELQCHFFIECRRKNLMSRYSNGCPRCSVRTTMPSLLILKISYVVQQDKHNASFLIYPGRDCPSGYKYR